MSVFSAGKTYTMFGPDEDPGLVRTMLCSLIGRLDEKVLQLTSYYTFRLKHVFFDVHKVKRRELCEWSGTCTIVQVYKNEVCDVLTPVGSGSLPPRKLQVLLNQEAAACGLEEMQADGAASV